MQLSYTLGPKNTYSKNLQNDVTFIDLLNGNSQVVIGIVTGARKLLP